MSNKRMKDRTKLSNKDKTEISFSLEYNINPHDMNAERKRNENM